MNTISKTQPVERFRKNIDLKFNTKQTLSLQAVQHGLSLKSYIEIMLERLAEMEEDQILAALSNVPETQTVLSGKDLKEFECELTTW
jgi:macrodomain Ter protein organizer (MatP/YcbG family)